MEVNKAICIDLFIMNPTDLIATGLNVVDGYIICNGIKLLKLDENCDIEIIDYDDDRSVDNRSDDNRSKWIIAVSFIFIIIFAIWSL